MDYFKDKLKYLGLTDTVPICIYLVLSTISTPSILVLIKK